MTVYELTSRINRLPEPFVKEVSDFVDFLLAKSEGVQRESLHLLREGTDIAEAGFSDYLSNLEDYETRLSRGEIRW